jgi:hypothetical protein
MYVYIQSEPQLWTVGFYRPGDNKWIPESDHGTPGEAAARVIELNGGARVVAHGPAEAPELCELCGGKMRSGACRECGWSPDDHPEDNH